jgi:tRNA (pseudouridine54-N1)-methyltransferase
MDVLIRCVRAALLISHGVRADTGVYLLLMGPPNPPITIYIRGSEARYLRPDERSIATTIKKALAKELPQSGLELIRNGIYIGAVGLSDILQFISSESSVFVLDEVGSDIRNRENASGKAAFIIGDHQGFSVEEWKIMSNFSKQQLSVGPVSLQAEDVIALVHNQLDREQILVP